MSIPKDFYLCISCNNKYTPIDWKNTVGVLFTLLAVLLVAGLSLLAYKACTDTSGGALNLSNIICGCMAILTIILLAGVGKMFIVSSKQCPCCKSNDIIPANSPKAVSIIKANKMKGTKNVRGNRF